MRTILFDIDGTLANIDHRRHLVRGPRKDWDAFFAGIPKDSPKEGTIDILNPLLLSRNADVVLVSGRPEYTREMTEEWLGQHSLWGEFPEDLLLMRQDGDYRSDVIVKWEMLKGLRGQGIDPVAVFDDRPSTIEMWREEGLQVFQVDPEQWTDVAPPNVEGKTLLTLMVGPSGAGKTSYLRPNPNEPVHPSVLSSDAIRKELFNDMHDQSNNALVFQVMHDMARARLRNGLPVVLDATHLRRKDRMKSASLAPNGTRVQYIVLDRPLEDKLRDAHTPEHVVRKHDQTFQSQLPDILSGDGLDYVEVCDLRRT